MIKKRGPMKSFLDVDKQIDEIVRNQFVNTQSVDVTFTAANLEVAAHVGFNCTQYVEVGKNANITFWRTNSDNQNMYFKASGAGTVTIKPIRGGQ